MTSVKSLFPPSNAGLSAFTPRDETILAPAILDLLMARRAFDTYI